MYRLGNLSTKVHGTHSLLDAQRSKANWQVWKALKWIDKDYSNLLKIFFLCLSPSAIPICQNPDLKSMLRNHFDPDNELRYNHQCEIKVCVFDCDIVYFVIVNTKSRWSIFLGDEDNRWWPGAARWFYHFSPQHNFLFQFFLLKFSEWQPPGTLSVRIGLTSVDGVLDQIRSS